METVYFNIIGKGRGTAEVVNSYNEGFKSAEDYLHEYYQDQVKCNPIGRYNQYGHEWMIHECYVDSGSTDYVYFATKL